MIEKKLVEKDVEVTVTEKRLVEMFTYEGDEYTKDDLLDHLMYEIMSDCDERLSDISRSYRCLTHWRHVQGMMTKNVYRQLYNIIHAKMKLIKSLDNDVDKD